MGAQRVVTAAWAMVAAVPLLGGCSAADESARPRETVTATVTEYVTGGPASKAAASPTAPAVKLRVLDGQTQRFETPSRNINCYLFASDIRRVECTLWERDFADPPRPDDCHLDWSPQFDLGTQATYGACRSDANDPQKPISLPYGAAAVSGPLVCTSLTAGLTCRNNRTGHGFMISRTHFDLF